MSASLNRKYMEGLAKRAEQARKKRPEARAETEAANAKQIELLYGGDATKWGCCIFCGGRKKNGKPCNRNEHFWALILPGAVPSMFGNHPLNMVFCCTECNNEKKKAALLKEHAYLRAYHDYVENFCPRLPYSRDVCLARFAKFKEFCEASTQELEEDSKNTVPYTEDIDAP